MDIKRNKNKYNDIEDKKNFSSDLLDSLLGDCKWKYRKYIEGLREDKSLCI
jgi:hypothetical protein